MKDVQFRYKSSVGVCGGARGGIISNKCIYKKKIKSTYHGVINVRPSTDAGPTTRGRRLVNGQIQTMANRLHISPSKIIRRANIGPTISTQRLGCSRWHANCDVRPTMSTMYQRWINVLLLTGKDKIRH